MEVQEAGDERQGRQRQVDAGEYCAVSNTLRRMVTHIKKAAETLVNLADYLETVVNEPYRQRGTRKPNGKATPRPSRHLNGSGASAAAA
jgi:hypothetical protein